jgi:N-acetylmuramoyl-L-alanine amidase
MKRLIMSFCVTVFLLLGLTEKLQETPAHASTYIYAPVVTLNSVENIRRDLENQKQIECLADNMYHESKGEIHKGRVAVAFVAINRTEESYFPDDICGVVKQKTKRKCEFSWYCDPEKKQESRKPLEKKLADPVYEEIKRLAEYIYFNRDSIEDPTKGALYFHAKYVKVKARGKKVKAVIQRHIFYNIKKT